MIDSTRMNERGRGVEEGICKALEELDGALEGLGETLAGLLYATKCLFNAPLLHCWLHSFPHYTNRLTIHSFILSFHQS